MPSSPISPCPSCPPPPRGGRTWLRGVLVVGDRRRVGDPRTAVACAGQHGRPRRTTREALPPCDSGRHPVHRARWYRVAAMAGGVPASRDGVRGLRPLGPQRGGAAHPRRAMTAACGLSAAASFSAALMPMRLQGHRATARRVIGCSATPVRCLDPSDRSPHRTSPACLPLGPKKTTSGARHRRRESIH